MGSRQRFRAAQKKKGTRDQKNIISAEHDGIDEPAGIKAMVEEMNVRMKKQQVRVDQAILRVMDIIEYLPEDSLEKEICEYRHIDMMSWRQIEIAVPMSRSQCNNRYNEAIRMLLQNARVKEIAHEEREKYEEYIQQKSEAKKWRKKWPKKSREIKSGKNLPEKKYPENYGRKICRQIYLKIKIRKKKAGIQRALHRRNICSSSERHPY